MRKPPSSAYAAAGVDVELGNRVKKGIYAKVRSTHGPEVLGRIGGFGGLFRAKFHGLRDPVLVSSVDGVGTKLKIAFAMNRHDTIGQDLVNHCINDIAVTGARPLFFLDYVAGQRLDPAVFDQLLRGLAKACKAGKCALIGGETAQMPDMYLPGEYDIAGTIVGVVERAKILDGAKVCPGDVLVGLHSSGLHTNGYSLARKTLFETMGLKVDSKLPGLRGTVGDELLRMHINYQPIMAALPPGVLKAAAHITGGGLIDNIPRVLPRGCDAFIESAAWRVPRIFTIISGAAEMDRREMYRVFNMGIGMVLIVAQKHTDSVCKQTKGRVIGRVAAGTGIVQVF